MIVIDSLAEKAQQTACEKTSLAATTTCADNLDLNKYVMDILVYAIVLLWHAYGCAELLATARRVRYPLCRFSTCLVL